MHVASSQKLICGPTEGYNVPVMVGRGRKNGGHLEGQLSPEAGGVRMLTCGAKLANVPCLPTGGIKELKLSRQQKDKVEFSLPLKCKCHSFCQLASTSLHTAAGGDSHQIVSNVTVHISDVAACCLKMET